MALLGAIGEGIAQPQLLFFKAATRSGASDTRARKPFFFPEADPSFYVSPYITNSISVEGLG